MLSLGLMLLGLALCLNGNRWLVDQCMEEVGVMINVESSAYLVGGAARDATKGVLGSASDGVEGRLEGRGVIVGRHDD